MFIFDVSTPEKMSTTRQQVFSIIDTCLFESHSQGLASDVKQIIGELWGNCCKHGKDSRVEFSIKSNSGCVSCSVVAASHRYNKKVIKRTLRTAFAKKKQGKIQKFLFQESGRGLYMAVALSNRIFMCGSAIVFCLSTVPAEERICLHKEAWLSHTNCKKRSVVVNSPLVTAD